MRIAEVIFTLYLNYMVVSESSRGSCIISQPAKKNQYIELTLDFRYYSCDRCWNGFSIANYQRRACIRLNQGDTFSVDIKVDPEGQPVRVVEINLKFDPAVVQIDSYNTILCDIGASKCSIAIGDFLGYNPMELLNDIDNTNGKLHLAHVVASSARSNSPGTYATLNFKVNSNASARQSTLDLTTAKLASANGYIPGVTASNGIITIVSVSSSASQAASAVVTTLAPKTSRFSAPMALIVVIGLILCNLRRNNR